MSNPASHQEMQELATFFDAVRFVLQQLVDAREILFRDDLRDDIRDAWADVRLEIEAVQSELQTGSPQITALLGVAGLSEAQLRFKMNAFNLAWDRFKTRGTLKLLGKVMDWINDLLQSILSAVPGGEAIKEFKDALENELSDENPN